MRLKDCRELKAVVIKGMVSKCKGEGKKEMGWQVGSRDGFLRMDWQWPENNCIMKGRS